MHTKPLSKFHSLTKFSPFKALAKKFFKQREFLAFHFDQKTLKTALISRQSTGIKIEHLQTFEDLNVKPLYILESLLAKKKELKIITAIEGGNTLLRELTLKLSSRAAIHKTLPFQLESLIPFPLEEAIIYPFFRKLDKNTTAISLFAIKIQHLEQHLTELKQFEITPDQVSCTPSALYHYARHMAPLHPNLIVFHVGEEKCTYICISSNELVLSQTLNIGKKHFLLNDLSSPNITRELQRVSAYLTKKVTCSEVMLTGELTPSIEQVIETAWKSVFSFIKNEHPSYAIPLGLCLQKENKEVQFLQGLYQAAPLIKKKRKFLFSCLASSLTLCALLMIGGTVLTKNREASLRSYLHSELSGEPDLSAALDIWEKQMKLQKKSSPFSITVPLVSDCLAWLSSHPKLEGIDIQKVHYTLIQFPKLSKENEPYEAKIELRFNAATPRQAREFHEVIMAGDSIINAKAPITWATHDEGYECSFYLTKKGGLK